MAVPAVVAFGALCLVISVPAVLADDCLPYFGSDFRFHSRQTCILSTCSGTCLNRYCNVPLINPLDQTQLLCVMNNLYLVIAVGLAVILGIIASIVACVCKCFCFSFQLCPQTQRATRVQITNVATQPAAAPVVYPPVVSNVGYQPLPSAPAYASAINMDSLPPSYQSQFKAYN
ncbi:protein shisa-5-like [Spea bombifrons]|uniref:protein shisa-5-like n=1 Tax=Spea bombifrons TaxID=233779 RepID=UPI00234A68D3|nr:protein shisa-5-like [Spea bombifrons]